MSSRANRAYVPSYQHDLFVSYACVDDVTDQDSDEESGWVTSLVSQLTIRVNQLLGRIDSVSIWKDDQLARNIDLDRQITMTLSQTAMLLVILSPGYLASEWCRRERHTFLKWMKDRLESGSRIFLVQRDMIEVTLPEEFGKPNEFKNLLGYQFWVEKNRRSRPLDRFRKSDEDEYKSRVNELAWDIAKELQRLKQLANVPEQKLVEKPQIIVTPAPMNGGSTIYLAEVTDDLRSLRKKLQRHFDQLGIPCISADAAILRDKESDSLDQAMDESLAGSQFFVQLLSKIPGPPVSDTRESLVAFQHRRAAALQKTILQWRDPTITEASWDVKSEADDEVDVEAHRALLFGATVQAVNLEDFKRNVVEIVQRVPTLPEETDGGLIFVNFNNQTDDAVFAKDLCGYLDQKGFGVIKPLDTTDPDVRRQDFDHSVRHCSGLIVDGDEEAKDWTRVQLGEIYKLFCVHKKPLYALALCAGPPANKDPSDPVGYKTPKMTVIDCQAGFDFEKLGPFLKVVQQCAENNLPQQRSPVVL